MCEKIPTLEGSFATFHGFHETVFFGEIASHDVLQDFARIATLLSGMLPQARL